MKVVVIPNAGEILEVMRPYLWQEITDLEVQDLLHALAQAGFIVSHEVEVDAEVVASIERTLTAPRSRSQHVRWDPKPRKLELGDDETHL